MSARTSRYDQIIERVFLDHFQADLEEFEFEREELARAADKLDVDRPKNLGDVIYTYRFRRPLPASVRSCAPDEKSWIIRLAGPGRYRFVAATLTNVVPTPGLVETKVPDSTPGIIAKYALGDEQALLAKLRYNRLIDIFTGVACYSLQSHLRTQVPEIGQIETDELYIGVDRRGVHYAFPVQAKGGRDNLSIVQVEQDIGLCADRFPDLVCRPIASQFMADDLIALFELEDDGREIRIAAENHYRLVPPDEVTFDDLQDYRNRTRQNL